MMRSTRRRFLGLTSLLALTACAPAARGRATPPATAGVTAAAGDLLFLGTKAGLRTLDATSGTITLAAARAVARPDWERLYTSTADGTTTRLATVEAGTGTIRDVVLLPGHLAVRAVSAGGALVALTDARAAGESPWLPAAREQTTLVVADPTGARPPRRFELAGNYEPEAFSRDERHLFVIEYLPPLAPDRYRVRRCDLSTGAIGPLLTLKGLAVPATAEEEMRGQGRQQVLAPDRSMLYTLYTLQADHQHTRDLLKGGARPAPDRAHVHAFVHVLSLNDGWAYCLDLPLPFGLGPAAAHTLALAPDGQRLFVVDAAGGQIAIADMQRLQVARVGETPLDARGGSAAAQVARDGRTLFVAGGEEIVASDSITLAPRERWPLGGSIGSLALSGDGHRLYAGLAGAAAILDAATGERLGRLTIPDLESIHHVGRRPPRA